MSGFVFFIIVFLAISFVIRQIINSPGNTEINTPFLWLLFGRHCPYCRNSVPATASVCEHCYRDIAPKGNFVSQDKAGQFSNELEKITEESLKTSIL